MINLSPWSTRKNPTPDRQKKGREELRKTVEQRRYLASVKYCQMCSKAVYPNANGEYALHKVYDEKRKLNLLICDECLEKWQKV